MKKIFCIIAIGMLASLSASAVTNVTQAIESESLPADQFRPIINKAVSDIANTDIPALVAAVNANATTASAYAYGQSDTNATTTVTLYTPRGIGDALVGKQGGSNRVWFATAATTNGWTIKLNE